MTQTNENLGPAEHIINSLLAFTDHMVHNRPGVVVADGRTKVGLRWSPVTHKVNEDGTKTVFRLEKRGKKNAKIEIGVMNGDGKIKSGRTEIGLYRKPGLFPEVAAWFYKQVAEVWKLDNEFAAKWASYAFEQEHRDLKVVLAAFMLVQSRKGDSIEEGGEHLFYDEDYRDVGEAMVLLQQKGRDLNPKLLLRIRDVLMIPEIAKINHELGFGKSDKRAFLGRWPQAVTKWLRYREENPKMLEGLVKAGFRTTVMELARRVRYKPTSEKFFETLRWKQKQADDGRRDMAIGKAVKAAESWADLDEAAICQRIEKDKPNWKRIVGLLPSEIGVTRAIMAAAIESKCMSDKDLIILTPTIEELGLLKVQEIREKVESAIANAEDMRAANIARNVRSKELKEKLEAGADKAVQKAVAEVMKDIRVYFIVDRSGSMEGALEQAKPMIAKFLQSFPLDRVHVSTFNTVGKVLNIKYTSTKGVEAAFRGVRAGGGTSHKTGIQALSRFAPKDEEDTLFVFVGDEGERRHFTEAVQNSGLRPMAFAILPVAGHWNRGGCIRDTANRLGIPCFDIDAATFEDPYAIGRTLRALVSSTEVGVTTTGRARARVSLVDQILQKDLLQKPAWA